MGGAHHYIEGFPLISRGARFVDKTSTLGSGLAMPLALPFTARCAPLPLACVPKNLTESIRSRQRKPKEMKEHQATPRTKHDQGKLTLGSPGFIPFRNFGVEAKAPCPSAQTPAAPASEARCPGPPPASMEAKVCRRPPLGNLEIRRQIRCPRGIEPRTSQTPQKPSSLQPSADENHT